MATRCMNPRCIHFRSVHCNAQTWECTVEPDMTPVLRELTTEVGVSLYNAIVIMVSINELQSPYAVPRTPPFSPPLTGLQTHHAVIMEPHDPFPQLREKNKNKKH